MPSPPCTLHPISRPSRPTDGPSILSIMDANVLWLHSINSKQWSTSDGELVLFSEDPKMNMGEYWKDIAGKGDLLHANGVKGKNGHGEKKDERGSSQTFVVEMDDWEGEKCKSRRRVGGFYMLDRTWPKYVPNTLDPSLFIPIAAIHPSLRHQGLGRLIVQHSKQLAKQLNINLIRLETYGGLTGKSEEGKKVIDAWERLGFERGERVSYNGVDLEEDERPWQQVMVLRVN